MPIEIRETTVIPLDVDNDVIQLHISDAARESAEATFSVEIHVKLRAAATPTLGYLQRAAMKTVQDELTPLLQNLAKELQQSGQGLELPPRNPRR